MNNIQNALLQALVTEISKNPALLAKALAGKELPVNQPTKTASDIKTEKQARFTMAVVKAFKDKGFGDVVPNVDVLTYGRWEQLGYRVKKGEKAVRIQRKGLGYTTGKNSGLPLFHKSQVEAINAGNVTQLRS